MADRELITTSFIRMKLLTIFAGYRVVNRRLKPTSARFKSMKYEKSWHLAKRNGKELR